MTVEEAVAAPGKKVQMWSESSDGKPVQAIYELTDAGAKQLAWRNVPAGQEGTITAELTKRGIAIATTESPCQFIWVISADGVEVYGLRSKALQAKGDRAVLDVGAPVARADIARVFAFADPDMEYRGIKAELRSGKVIDLVTEVSAAAEVGAGYSRNDLLMETGWTGTLGAAIAKWAGVGFESRI